MEMPGLWKAWKAKSRLPTLSTSPLEISPTPGEIPTFPQRRRRRRWKSGKPKAGFPLSHRPEDILGKPTKSQGGRASPCARQTLSTTTKGDLSRQPGRRHFQAHAALESNCRFRLMAYWNQFSISGSFVDWNMLRGNTGCVYTSRFLTSSALSSINWRRGSTTSPISTVKMESASTWSSTLTCNMVRWSASMVVSHN